MKINANKPALNSTLNPETSSASPSGRSNGARFVSAKTEIIQGIKMGRKIILAIELIFLKFTNEKEFPRRQIVTMKKIILTS
jgi:hypothetical protein